ncbi:MAG: M28 family metallopeptidase [Christensenellales bacterium]|jgi:hypothetical protein
MDKQSILRIFKDTAYVRTGGSPEEKRCAEYITEYLKGLGLKAALVPFEVDMATIQEARLMVDGQDIPCKGYLSAGTGNVEAPLYYLRNQDAYSLSQCKGRIVLIEGYLRHWTYQDMLDNGALGFITYSGDVHHQNEDIDQRELRASVSQGRVIPGVNINAKQAVRLVEAGAKQAKIVLKQEEYKGQSHNVVFDLPGETDEWLALTAHYDSTSLSQGAYDNMSGSIGLLSMAKRFSKMKTRYGLRFIWCGAEERGLLGAKAYTQDEEALKSIALCVNLDMIGSAMGGFIACATAEEKLVHYVQYLSQMKGFGLKARQGVYSSDSTPFADKGIPAISFARIAPANTATIHNRYDTLKLISVDNMVSDIQFIGDFVEAMAQAAQCPVSREMPEKMKEKLDIYLARKRDDKEE